MTWPNILLITTDQHNAEIMGCAGNPVVKMPHLDSLAHSCCIPDNEKKGSGGPEREGLIARLAERMGSFLQHRWSL